MSAKLPKKTPETVTYCVVQTTVASQAQAEALARLIVEARLGACVQLQPIRSFYRWTNEVQSEVRDEPEFLLQVKTRQACYPALEAFIRAHHSYETPEIVQLPIGRAQPTTCSGCTPRAAAEGVFRHHLAMK